MVDLKQAILSEDGITSTVILMSFRMLNDVGIIKFFVGSVSWFKSQKMVLCK